jgi:hypothetical protein
LSVVRQALELLTPLNQRVERPDHRVIGFQLPERTHSIGFGRALEPVLVVVDVEADLFLEELAERAIHEVEDPAASHVEEGFKASAITRRDGGHISPESKNIRP